MPIYEYKCTKCDKIYEYMESYSADPVKVCEACGASAERVISNSSFHLKGGGWYTQGYANTPAKCDAAGSSSCSGCPHSNQN